MENLKDVIGKAGKDFEKGLREREESEVSKKRVSHIIESLEDIISELKDPDTVLHTASMIGAEMGATDDSGEEVKTGERIFSFKLKLIHIPRHIEALEKLGPMLLLRDVNQSLDDQVEMMERSSKKDG